jgi:hypothetical protein
MTLAKGKPLSYEDLVAYDHIDQEVERLYRAFLDTSLLEQSEKEGADYWTEVMKIRQDNQGVFKRFPGILYWFDLRADYWSKSGREAEVIKVVPASDLLRRVCLEAEALEQRIARAKGQGSQQRPLWRSPSPGKRSDSLPPTANESILARVVGTIEESRSAQSPPSSIT